MNTLEYINIKYWEMIFSSSELGHKSQMDYSAKCPICGDSRKKKNLKRCHLFTKPSWEHDIIHCFNCHWTGSMYKFIEHISPGLLQSYKSEKRSESFNSLLNSNKKEEIVEDFKIDVSFFDDVRELPPKLFDLPLEFKQIEVGDDFYNYLKSRCMSDEQINLFRKCESSVVYNNEAVPLVGYIILPLWCNNKVYGFQARSIKEKKFYTFIPEENHGYKVWNWFDINVSEPVYIFESYFDALSSGIKNSTAQLGANLSEDRLNEIEEAIFALDNQRVDKTAKEESIKYLKRGFKVMIWPKGINHKDFNSILQLSKDSTKISKFIKKNVSEGLSAIVSLTL